MRAIRAGRDFSRRLRDFVAVHGRLRRFVAPTWGLLFGGRRRRLRRRVSSSAVGSRRRATVRICVVVTGRTKQCITGVAPVIFQPMAPSEGTRQILIREQPVPLNLHSRLPEAADPFRSRWPSWASLPKEKLHTSQPSRMV
jgi:hypothetical protein